MALPLQATYTLQIDDIVSSTTKKHWVNTDPIIISIPLKIENLIDETKDLYVSASYGGINKKDIRNSFGNTEKNPELEQQVHESHTFRTLRYKKQSIDYRLLNDKKTHFSEIKSSEDILHEDDVIIIKKRDQIWGLGITQETAYINIMPNKLPLPGTYVDVLTFELYDGKYNDLNQALIETNQSKISIKVPKIAHISDMKWTPLNKDKTIFKLTFKTHCNINTSLLIQPRVNGRSIEHLHYQNDVVKKENNRFQINIQANQDLSHHQLFIYLDHALKNESKPYIHYTFSDNE